MITMSRTLATSSHTATTLAHGPWASPMLDPVSFRLLFPLAAGQSEEGQIQGACLGHPAAGTSNFFPSKTVSSFNIP